MGHPITGIAEGLIEYLQAQRLFEQLPELIALLQIEADRTHEVTVVSAETLSEADKKEIVRQTETAWGRHPVSFFVDPLLVAGMLVRFQGQLLDLSTRARLTDLKEYLA